ncbi:ring finger protein 217 [Nothobranchius furzeri]|uniref:Ring finger protein 217 n=1 Tax=Nothobranchius furzeri TaxID=105023 RepID=A0A9D2Z1Y9_NOTFU|nr:ring finger protein 217 [Nothobranchius furzeri]
MGRATPGMEDEGPIADDFKMPSFISNFEEGRLKSFRNLHTETSFTDGKVGDLNRGVIRSSSRLSLDGSDGIARQRSGEEEKDAEGNINNNCNGGDGGRARRRASAVELLRIHFGDSKSPSFHLSTKSRMQFGAEHGTDEGSGKNGPKGGNGAECSECLKSDAETGGPGTKNEPTLSELATSSVQGVEKLPVTDERHHKEDDNGNSTLGDSFRLKKEHVFCTVYCIANDSLRSDAEITDGVTSEAAENESGEVESSELELFSLGDLVDPMGHASDRQHREQSDDESDACCRVCLEEKTIASLPCCRRTACADCLKLYVSTQVGENWVGVDLGMEVERSVSGRRVFRSYLSTIQCSSCQFVWCFRCHAPWHDGLKCRDYRKADKLLRTWASVIEHGQRNAQKCPQCKIHIQRIDGCDHMTCTQCNTNFCYRCGERYRHLRFFGDHTSNLSVFGCKYRYLPDKPHLRRLVRGSVCASKVLIAPVVLLLVIVLGALALVIGLVAFPVYYACKRRKKQQQQHTQGSGRWI